MLAFESMLYDENESECFSQEVIILAQHNMSSLTRESWQQQLSGPTMQLKSKYSICMLAIHREHNTAGERVVGNKVKKEANSKIDIVLSRN